ncbi:Exodeoxyribonuclease 7 large subunit [Aquimixticola soesokkakensis]|uniref:Exodeoxyribonuclease 7 large subunit n=1 Tax=Aquimixticola soesokkakensis TaxID=1519096 RepID=A0A1Y5S2U9_9RHOB|nr:exodeoxyribonuclease VII large subunit [Aquimixticola soesokkakensis]SLN31379.1 Exodeoxyribonuclease 7 large subunit [Aquimixticola soesokkakensis]
MDLFEDDTAQTPSNAPEFSVSELSGAVKRTIESGFSHIRVRGEVGRVTLARTGHLYFDLKDERAVLSAISWKGQVAKMTVRPEEGMEVIATGRMTTFAGQSRYQMTVENVEPAGAGALMAMLEKRKALLASEGLFDPARKRPLPYLPDIIGVVTSPTGAVIRDILHRLRERFARKVLIWPVAVQGQNCAAEVANAINGFNALTPGGALPRPDLLIVARGGGSVEDLWGFNEEIVARAAAASRIPLISAVGHETDTTLIDFVSDRRAPTPTAAAEIAVPVRLELATWVSDQETRMARSVTQAQERRAQRLRDLARSLARPERALEAPQQRFDRASERLDVALQGLVAKRSVELARTAAALRPAVLQARIAAAQERAMGLSARLAPALARGTNDHHKAFARVAQRLDGDMVSQIALRKSEALATTTQRFSRVTQGQISDWRARLDALERMRQTLGYTATLTRGYAVVRGAQGLVTSAQDAAAIVSVEFSDGLVAVGPGAAPAASAQPESTQGASVAQAGPKKAKRKAQKKSDAPPDQGSLF